MVCAMTVALATIPTQPQQAASDKQRLTIGLFVIVTKDTVEMAPP